MTLHRKFCHAHTALLPARPVPLPARPVSLPARPVSLPARPVPLPSRPVSLSARPVPLPARPVPLLSRPALLLARSVLLLARPVLTLCVSVLFCALLPSCAVLTKSQLDAVTKLSVASDTVAASPKKLFDELTTIRLERGVYYAASLTAATAREKEVNALAAALISDESLSQKAEVYVNVLNSYLRALRSLSADARWSAYGTEWRGIGRNIDSLFLRFNQTELLETSIPVGWAKLSGQYMGYMSERYMRLRQAKAVKSFVTQGDTLLSACVEGLIDLLKKGELIDLIENESVGLKSNYAAYLHRLEQSGFPPDLPADRNYIELVKRMEVAKYTRSRCVTALQSLKRAHAKLVTALEKRQKVDFFFNELLELNTLALQLANNL